MKKNMIWIAVVIAAYFIWCIVGTNDVMRNINKAISGEYVDDKILMEQFYNVNDDFITKSVERRFVLLFINRGIIWVKCNNEIVVDGETFYPNDYTSFIIEKDNSGKWKISKYFFNP